MELVKAFHVLHGEFLSKILTNLEKFLEDSKWKPQLLKT